MSERRPPRFYSGPAPLLPGTVILSAEESRHARGARRLGPGDEVQLFDGLGCEAVGRIAELSHSAVSVTVQAVSRQGRDAPVDLTLAVAMPKGGRQDTLIEKCTELGVSTFWSMDCARSVVRPSSRRLEKWRRVAIAACKQSRRAWLPSFSAGRSFSEVLQHAPEFDVAFLACQGGAPINRLCTGQHLRVLILVGPEGGFTDAERATAQDAKLQSIALSPIILRTETAAVAAAAQIVGAVLGDCRHPDNVVKSR